MQGPPETDDVDYQHTSARPEWSALPEHVRAAVGHLAGSPVAGAFPAVSTGFTGAYAGRLRLQDGRAVFAKAAGPSTPHAHGALAQEATVLAALPHGIPAPGLLGAAESQDWNLLVLVAIDGHMPGQPWTGVEVDATHAATLAVAEAGTPVPSSLEVGDLGADLTDATTLNCAAALEDRSFRVPEGVRGIPDWLLARGPELAGLARASSGLRGESLVHGDLRPDNLLVDTAGAAWIVDWNWVTRGPAWVDLAGLLPLMAWQGVDVAALVRRSPLIRAVDADEVDAFLAAVAVYMVANLDAPPPPGCTPALRQHQQLMARTFLRLLGRRRGWS